MATKNEWDELMRVAQGAPQTQQAAFGDVGAQRAASYPDPGKITQSYYQNPSDATNYETGRPVYEQSQAVQDAGNALNEHRQNKPGEYQSAYGEQIQQLIDQALNRKPFAYDAAADPLYQQYADRYQTKGQMAMMDAMGQSAALTGGYGNSYAQQAGQQAYQTYMLDLAAKVPELAQMAYQKYRDEGDELRGNIGLLQGQDDREYGKYRDRLGDWKDELSYLYGAFSDMSQQEYNRYMNDSAAWEKDRAYWYQKAYDEQQQSNWQAEFNARYGSGGGRGGGSRKKEEKKPIAIDTSDVGKGVKSKGGGLMGSGKNRKNEKM